MSVVGRAGVTTDDQTNAEERRQAGEFVRGVSSARHWIQKASATTTAPSKDCDNDVQYPVESGRYHLVVAYNCPSCHRVLLARSMLGLENVISVDVTFPSRSSGEDDGRPNLWQFRPEGYTTLNGRLVQFPECTADTVFGGQRYVKDIYVACGIEDQKSVPILLDLKTKTVVNNESAEIVRMMETEMKELSRFPLDQVPDLYPMDDESKRQEIDALNDWIYKDINNGSYKAGFSSNQDVYEASYQSYFAALDRLESILVDKLFLTGPNVSESDLRLFPTLYRHDPVYYNRFKLNERYLWEYPNLWQWMGRMVSLKGMAPVSGTGYLAQCKQGYFGRTGNNTIPVGPVGYPECYKDPNWATTRQWNCNQHYNKRSRPVDETSKNDS